MSRKRIKLAACEAVSLGAVLAICGTHHLWGLVFLVPFGIAHWQMTAMNNRGEQ